MRWQQKLARIPPGAPVAQFNRREIFLDLVRLFRLSPIVRLFGHLHASTARAASVLIQF